jgi:vesicular inhibitory amino acid transporter
MLADMFGLGTLSLPADYARLGWAPALAFTVLFALGDVYTGVIYQRLSLAVPRAKVFDQIGYAAHGRVGQILVFCTIYLTILGEPIIFHLTCMESLKQVSKATSQLCSAMY